MACEKKCLQRSEIQIETCRGLPTLAYGSGYGFELLTATTPSIFQERLFLDCGCDLFTQKPCWITSLARSETPPPTWLLIPSATLFIAPPRLPKAVHWRIVRVS